jgi:hypothetical protein
MDRLGEILKEEVSWYAGNGQGVGLRLYRSLDDVSRVYAVFATPDPDPDHEGSEVVVMARIEGERIIIEVDNTDRPLVRHLMEMGVPREQIILAYEGEAVGNAASG